MGWVLIALGSLAAALGLWDIYVEADGGELDSLGAVAIGVLVILLGYMRRQAQ